MYKKEDFFYTNYKDLDDKYKPYFKQLFGFDSSDTSEKYLEKTNTYAIVMTQIEDNNIHHIFQRINMFFMFKDQYEVIEHRYLRRNQNEDIIETPWELADRVATFVALSEPRDRTSGIEKLNKWYPVFLIMLLDMKLSPNTPTWSSAGIPGFGSFACSVVYNDDSLEGINKWYRDVLFMNRFNFGIGHSLHKFRPEGAPFGSSKTTTKSPLKWLNVVQEMATSMQQGDSGRGGANMVTIPVWHPSVLEFIDYKKYPQDRDTIARQLMKNVMISDLSTEDKEEIIEVIDKQIPLKNFNMSVVVNDKFMQAVEDDTEWTLFFELPDKSWKQEIKMPAKDLWNKIIQNAHESGDPGLMFFDRINKDNHVKNIYGDIYTSNPCSEQALPEYSICNLWTINLMKHINFYHKTINWASIRDSINVAVRAADNLITQNEYPREVPELESHEKQERRIGIDFTGLADFMFVLGIKYGSRDSCKLVNSLYSYLRKNTRRYSAILGNKKGSFPLLRQTNLYYPNNKYDGTIRCPKCNAKTTRYEEEGFIECNSCNWAKYKYLRNVDLTTQSPTGTRSRKLGVSFGIEPQMYKWWKSNVMEGKVVYNVNHNLEWYLKKWCVENNCDFQDIIKSLDEDEFSSAPSIGLTCRKEVLENWVEAHDLLPKQHLEIQAIAQKWISNGVSKTLNLGENATVEDVDKIYRLAWKKDLKGVTIYRKGSHYKEVIGEDIECPSCKSKEILAIEGCFQCKKCSWSKCEI
ncbi:MAG: adenosylcobalamin-dependent ribonucleoside-diphosphate reductase [Candidatus Hodarchaeales archaeon]|jgi:ribonucleoside-diphosphate reductase alpha chain